MKKGICCLLVVFWLAGCANMNDQTKTKAQGAGFGAAAGAAAGAIAGYLKMGRMVPLRAPVSVPPPVVLADTSTATMWQIKNKNTPIRKNGWTIASPRPKPSTLKRGLTINGWNGRSTLLIRRCSLSKPNIEAREARQRATKRERKTFLPYMNRLKRI